MRLKTFLVKNLNVSNSDAEQLIYDKKVFINGRRGRFGSFVDNGDEVRVDGNIIQNKANFIYLAYNKPAGVESTLDESVDNNLSAALGFHERVFPVGRLDKDSEGLILLTNNGDIYNKITRSEFEKEKEYLVTVNRPIDDDFIENMQNGLVIMGKLTKPSRLIPVRGTDKTFRIILTEGMNRQIRRMCHKLNYQVRKLKRIRIINIKLNDLKIGTYRELSDSELQELFLLIGHSNKKQL